MAMRSKRFFIAVLGVAVMLTGCAGMTDKEQRMATGATIGGAAVGVATGSWGWAAVGAAAGAGTGYLIEAQRQRERAAFERGIEEGRGQ
jgi:osmotically inducible lipoprotein OsmB